MNGRRMERLRGNRARELLPAAGLITEAVLSSLHKYKYSVTSAGSPFCSSIYCTGLLLSSHYSGTYNSKLITTMVKGGKPVMLVGIDDSDHSYYALEWTLKHFFAPGQPQQYHLVLLTSKPPASAVIGIAGLGNLGCTLLDTRNVLIM